jgi:hypothetical protein
VEVVVLIQIKVVMRKLVVLQAFGDLLQLLEQEVVVTVIENQETAVIT